MAEPPIDPLPYESLERLETTIARLRYIIIAVVIVMIAGFSFLGVQVGPVNGHIDQIVAKVDGLDAALGVKFEAVNAKFDAISQRLAVEFKTIGGEISAQSRAIAKSVVAPPAPAQQAVPAQPVPAPVQSKPAPVPPKSRP